MSLDPSVEIEHGNMEKNIKAYCKLLTLPGIVNTYEKIALQATKAKMSYQEYLYKVLQEQVIARVADSAVELGYHLFEKLDKRPILLPVPGGGCLQPDNRRRGGA